MHIEVTRDVLAAIRAEAESAHPLECCGILLGEQGRIVAIEPARNVHPSPETRFEIDPQALIDAYRAERSGGRQVIGFYHSHPGGEPEPSATDRDMAAGDGRVWAIVADVGVSFWRDGRDGFAGLSYSVEDA